MRFTLEADPDSNLRLVPEIPDFDLCRIEGLNGIGKSLSVRLVQLCTGVPVYRDQPAAWASLLASFTRISIAATDLEGAREITWILQRDLLPDEPVALADNNFASIAIDGRKGSLGEVRDLLSIERIGGDDTLPIVLGRQVRHDEGAIRRFRDGIGARTSRVLPRLEELAADLSRINIERYEHARARLEELRPQVARLRTARSELQHRVDELTELSEMAGRIDRIFSDAPSLQTEIDSLDEQITAVRAERAEIEPEIDELRSGLERREQVSGQYDRAQEQLERALRRRAKREREVGERATECGLVASVGAAEAALSDAIAQKRRLARERRSLDVTPQMLDVTGSLAGRLTTAIEDGLASEEVASLSGGAATVVELHDGVAATRRALIQRELPRAVQELDAKLAELAERERSVRSLLSGFKELAKDQRSIRKLEKKLRDLYEELSDEQELRFAESMARREEMFRREVSLTSRRSMALTQLHQLGDAAERAELEQRLASRLAALGLSREALGESTVSAVSEKGIVEDQLEALDGDLAIAARELREEEAGAALCAEVLGTGSDYEWLRASLRSAVPDPTLEAQEKVHRILTLRTAVDSTIEAIRQLLDDLAGIEASLAGIADSITRGAPAQRKMRGWAALIRFYESRLSDEFRDGRIQAALFPGGEFESLSLEELSVHWRDEDGRSRTRALEAFSSGERAFAYTLAQLSVRTPATASNRLLVLDEFGAFVSYDRMSELVPVLREEVLGRIADQIVVILPLTHDLPVQPMPPGRVWPDVGYFAAPFEAVP